VVELVSSSGEIHPHLAVANLYREDARLIGKLIESTAAFQVKASVVPVTGQDAVLYSPPVQREAHVGTAIVHGVYLAVVEEERERTTGEADGDAPSSEDLVQPSGSHQIV